MRRGRRRGRIHSSPKTERRRQARLLLHRRRTARPSAPARGMAGTAATDAERGVGALPGDMALAATVIAAAIQLRRQLGGRRRAGSSEHARLTSRAATPRTRDADRRGTRVAAHLGLPGPNPGQRSRSARGASPALDHRAEGSAQDLRDDDHGPEPRPQLRRRRGDPRGRHAGWGGHRSPGRRGGSRRPGRERPRERDLRGHGAAGGWAPSTKWRAARLVAAGAKR